MRVLVCGGRDFDDYHKLANALDSALQLTDDDWLAPSDTVIIHGGARGADALADRWAIANWLVPEVYPANWDDLTHSDAIIRKRPDGTKYDAKAGIRRNTQMLIDTKPDLVIAFPGGKGTQNMKEQAREAGVRVIEVESEDELGT
jgi:hypothetical protein